MNKMEGQKNLPQESSLQRSSDDEVDFVKLILIIWHHKLTLFIIATLFLIVSVAYAISIPNQYQSSVLVYPVVDSGASSLSKMAGQLGGLASLAGISVDSGSVDRAAVAMEVMKSRWFLEGFIRKYGLEEELYAVKGWDRDEDKLKYDLSLYNPSDSTWVQIKDSPSSEMPSGWETYKALLNRIYIAQNSKTGFINITVQYYSPSIAKDWVEKLVVDVNDYLRQQDRKDAFDSIQYLNMQIEKTNISEMKAVFYKIIEEKTKTLLLTEIGEEYVLKTISPAMVAEVKSTPKRSIMVLFGLLFGIFFGLVFVVVKVLVAKYG
jgi:uncharacterized protein involved in exopolysaccharide biosynthesis